MTCSRCPAGTKKCSTQRHQCKKCMGLGVTADWKLCPHPEENALSVPGPAGFHPIKRRRKIYTSKGL